MKHTHTESLYHSTGTTATRRLARIAGVAGVAAVLAILLLLVAGPVQSVQAACGGTTQVSNQGELNLAIAAFNGASSPCGFTIELTGDIDLTASTSDINNSTSGVELIVDGNGHTIDVQGVLDARAFDIQADTTVTIRQITVTGGNTTGPSNTGAVINVRDGAMLTLTESTLTGNRGSLGGVLSNSGGTVIVNNSTLNNNRADGGFLPLGGAIWNGGATVPGVVTVNNSTLSGNYSDTAGGAIYNSSDGILNLDSSTISNNEAKNGGGIASSTDTTVTLRNTIIANSVGGDCYTIDNAIINAEHSLIEDGLSCVNGTDSNNKTGDPMLAALADNGGPTQTQALQAGSPAIDAGSTTLTTDQRGLLRPAGTAPDIGAFEAGANAPGPLRFTIGAPGEQTSQVTTCSDLRVETFDEVATGSYDGLGGTNTGVYRSPAGSTKFEIVNQNEFGGADQPGTPTRFISTTASEYTLTLYDSLFPGGAGYFGFWWSAGDGENQLEVTRADGSVEKFSTQSILNSPTLQGTAGTAGGHFGNPTAAYQGDNPGEAYAFVNIYAQDDASRIKSIRFIETGPSSFESDNHTVCAELIDRTDQGGADLGGIVIRKSSGPAGGTGFGFTDDIESPNNFSLDDGQNKTFLNAIPGTYTVAETDPSATPGGYTLTDIECVDGDPSGDASSVDVPSRTATILLDPNETVTCTFRNEGPRDYGDAPDSYGTTNAANGAYHFFSPILLLGTFVDREADGIPTPGADGDDLDNTDDEDALGVLPDLVRNTGYALNIPVINTTGSQATLYGWIDFDGNGSFDASERTLTSVNPASGSYGLSWPPFPGTVAGRSYVRIRLSDQADENARPVGPLGTGEVEDYPIEIVERGTIIIQKQTAPSGGTSFIFGDDIEAPNSFTLADGQSKTFANVAPGTYAVNEVVPNNYKLTDLRCDDSSSATPSTGDISSATATINLDPGETVTCTFINSEDEAIAVKKVTIPAGGTGFDFTDDIEAPNSFSLDDNGVQLFDNVPPFNTYTITETDPGPTYDITGISCDVYESVANGGGLKTTVAGDTNTGAVTLDLDEAGLSAACVYTNTRRSTLIIAKETLPDGDPQQFSFIANSSVAGPPIPPIGDGERATLDNLQSDTWTIQEAIEPNWTVTDVKCKSATGASKSTPNVGFASATVELAPGDTVTCTFTNSKDEHITINKVTVPAGGQGFDFNNGAYTLNDGDRFTVDVAGNPFTVTEDDPSSSGYAVTDITCTDNQGSPSYTIDVDARQVDFAAVPGLVAGCTYTNTLLGGIIIEKVTEPALTDSFTFIAPLQPYLFALGNGDTQKFHNVLPGRYRVTEASQPTGVRLADIRCDDGNSATPSVPVVRDSDAIVNVDPGETVKCTFVNAEDDTIIIKKVTEPAGDTVTDFTFNSDLPGGASFMLKDSAQQLFTDVVPGQVYSISEIDPTPGYDLTDLSCFDSNTQQTFQGDLASRSVSFTPEPGHTIACTFVNQARGKIVINKSVQPPGGNEVFNFTNDIETPAIFDLSDGGSKQFLDIPAGQYTVEELVGGADTRLAAITCVDSASNGVPSAGDPATARATINLDPGETVECTFVNAENDTVIIQKITDPAGDTTTGFSFSSDLPNAASFMLKDGGLQTVPGVPSGQDYFVTEADPTPGYDLTDLNCYDTSNGATFPGDLATRTVNFSTVDGHTIHCDFVNTKRGSITIAKATTPTSGDSFDFMLTGAGGPYQQTVAAGSQQVIDNLEPGAYVLSESDPTPTHDLASIECVDGSGAASVGDVVSGTANINLAPGENVTCTYTNQKRGEIRIQKTVTGGPTGPFDFAQTIDNTGNFQLNGGGEQLFSYVMAGSYTVAELTPPAGSVLADIVCDDSASTTPSTVNVNGATATINVEPGEVVTCTFTNEKAGDLPAVRLTESFAVTRVEEGKLSGEGSIACYWVTLSSDPGAGDVVVAIDPPTNGQVTVDKSSVTLNASNWNSLTVANRSNFVCVRAVDDHIVDGGAQICRDGNSDIIGNGTLVPDKECGDHTDVIPHRISSATATGYSVNTPFERRQPNGSYLNGSTVPALVEDNDQAGVHITESYAVTDLDENGTPVGLACYWINLTSMPSAPVTVNVTTDTHLSADKAAITLDGGNWNVLDPLTMTNRVCLTPVDDNIINQKDVRCALKNQDIFGNGPDDRQVCGSYLSHVNHSASSADAAFNGTSNFSGNGPNFDGNAATIDAMIRDDDVARVIVAPAHLNVVEGGSAALGIKLSSQPSQPVTVSSNVAAASAASLNGANDQQVIFDASNWDQEQRMTIQIPENDSADGVQEETITLSVNSADANFQSVVIEPVSVVVVDNDSAGIALSSTHLELSENGGEGSYQLSLTSQPSADLVVTLLTGDQLIANPAQVTFTPANWQQAQRISVSAVDDTQMEANGHAGLIRHTVASADSAYNAIQVSDVGASIEDNDAIGLESSGADNLQVSEGAGSAIYSLRLNARPESDVLVSLAGGAQLTVEPASLTFTPENWDQTQAVSVKAVDDAIAEGGLHVGVVSYNLSGDSDYAGLAVSEQLVTITDDDTAGLALSTTALDIASGATGSYAVSLASQPVDTVLVDLATAGAVQLAMADCGNGGEEGGPCLIFTPENWNQAQNISVQAFGPGQVKHMAISGDDVYDGLAGQSVSVNGGGTTFDIFLFLPVISR